MEDSRMDAAPVVPFPAFGSGLRPEGEQPSERAHPVLVLTPVAEPQGAESWAGTVYVVVAGIAVLAITAAGLGRRVGVAVRLTAL